MTYATLEATRSRTAQLRRRRLIESMQENEMTETQTTQVHPSWFTDPVAAATQEQDAGYVNSPHERLRCKLCGGDQDWQDARELGHSPDCGYWNLRKLIDDAKLLLFEGDARAAFELLDGGPGRYEDDES